MKLSEDVLVKPAFDGQIPPQRPVGRQVGSRPFDLGDDGGQTGGGGIASGDLDVGARIGASHDVAAVLGEADIVRNTATRNKAAESD
jgi:hypothetical protein